MAQTTWQDYLKLMRDLTAALETLTQVEREKNDAASQGDLAGVEDCMKQEQVISLSLRGTDQKREKLLAQLGLSGVPLRELEERGPREAHMETRRAVESLRRKYEVFQSASEVARNTLECNLRAIEKMQKAQDAPPEEAQPHQADFRV